MSRSGCGAGHVWAMASETTVLAPQPPCTLRGMVRPLSDTHPDAERVQFELLRNATVAQRFRLMRSLMAMTRRLSRRAIRRAHPDDDEAQAALRLVSLLYGPDLASRVRAHLEAQADDRGRRP